MKQKPNNFYLKNGDTFEGTLLSWKLQGLVKYTFKNGDQLKAHFFQGKPKGKFTYTQQSSNHQIEVEAGQIYPSIDPKNLPKVKLQYPDNSIFQGTISSTTLLPNGQNCEIMFHQSNQNLKYFRGKFENGVPIFGKLNFKNGDVYEGFFDSEGFYTGISEIFLARQKIRVKGNFIKGEVMSGEVRFENGDVYEGQMSDFVPHGRGVLKFENGDVYEGDFKFGKKHGKGQLVKVKEDGNRWVYTGAFEDGEFNGKGEISDQGYLLKGFFFDGKLDGEYKIVEDDTGKEI